MLKNLDVDGVMVGFLAEICLTGDFLLTLRKGLNDSIQRGRMGLNESC